MYQLTYEELDVCEAINVINTAYNRIISARFMAAFGDHLYTQMIAPDQFVVYQNGSNVSGGVELVEGGNVYFNLLTEEDRLEDFRVQKDVVSLKLAKYNYLLKE